MARKKLHEGVKVAMSKTKKRKQKKYTTPLIKFIKLCGMIRVRRGDGLRVDIEPRNFEAVAEIVEPEQVWLNKIGKAVWGKKIVP